MADGTKSGSGRLTTHVLDTMAGRPAAGLALALFALEPDGSRNLLGRATTNTDGRLDAPLLGPGTIRAGRFGWSSRWRLFPRPGRGPPRAPFLEAVPIRFGIADADAHYHVPLLVSPCSYTTCRGS